MHYCTLHKHWYDDYCTWCFEEGQDGWDFFINPKQEETDIMEMDAGDVEEKYKPTILSYEEIQREEDEEPWWRFNKDMLDTTKTIEDKWCP